MSIDSPTDLLPHTLAGTSEDYELNGMARDCIVTHYKSGRLIEQRGRHMRRQAVAAEYNSGRVMTRFAKDVGTPIRTIRDLLNEARNFGMLNSDVTTSPEDAAAFSEACPTQADAREWARTPVLDRQQMQAEVAKAAPAIKVAKAKNLIAKFHSRTRLGPDPSKPFETVASAIKWDDNRAADSAVEKLTEAVDLLHQQKRKPELQALADHLAELGYQPAAVVQNKR